MSNTAKQSRPWWKRLFSRGGTASPTVFEQVAETKARRELLQEQAALKRLSGQVAENYYYPNGEWLGYYSELLSRNAGTDGYWPIGPAGNFDRKAGRNFPFFQTEQELTWLRQQSRIIVGKSPNAKGFVEGLCSYVVGLGFTYTVGPNDDEPNDEVDAVAKACQKVVDAHLERNHWHGGEQPGLEEESFKRSVAEGEFILVHFPQEDGTVPVRIAEPEQLTQPAGSGEECTFGVETSTVDTQTPKGYYFAWDYNSAETERFTTEEVIHFRRNAYRNTKRGMPDFVFDTHDALDIAAKLRINLGESAAEQAAIVSVMQYAVGSSDVTSGYITANGSYQQTDPISGRQESVDRYKRGRHEHIPKGQQYVEGPAAANAAAHMQIHDALLRAAGRPWNAPEWMTSGDASQTNYASSLTAESPFVMQVLREQRSYCEALAESPRLALKHWCQTRGLRANGRTYGWDEVNALVKISATAPNPVARDKNQEAQRDQTYVTLGVKSRQLCAEEQGYDYERVQRENKEYAEENPDAGGMGGLGAMLPPGGPQPGGFDDGSVDPMGGDIGDDNSGVMPESMREALFENGFTGTITDAAGRKQTYVNGEHVAGQHGGDEQSRELSVKKLTKQIVGKQKMDQPRSKAGGEFGPNDEWYPGGAFIATQDMPKRLKDKLKKSAIGKVQVDGYEWEVPKPGMMSILNKLGGTVLNPRNGEVNYQFLQYQRYTPEEVAKYEEVAEKWRQGERWVSVNDYPMLANLTDVARLFVAGEPIPGEVVDRMPDEFKTHLKRLTRSESFTPLPASLAESIVSESFTGIVIDAMGRHRKFVNGQPVPMEKAVVPKQKRATEINRGAAIRTVGLLRRGGTPTKDEWNDLYHHADTVPLSDLKKIWRIVEWDGLHKNKYPKNKLDLIAQIKAFAYDKAQTGLFLGNKDTEAFVAKHGKEALGGSNEERSKLFQAIAQERVDHQKAVDRGDFDTRVGETRGQPIVPKPKTDMPATEKYQYILGIYRNHQKQKPDQVWPQMRHLENAMREMQAERKAKGLPPLQPKEFGEFPDVPTAEPETPKAPEPRKSGVPEGGWHKDIPVMIRGETYANRDLLRKYGRFDYERKAWVVSQKAAQEIKAKNIPGLKMTMDRQDIAFYHNGYESEPANTGRHEILIEGVIGEYDLIESGFTGTITDAAGRKQTYVNGEHVTGQQSAESDPKFAKADQLQRRMRQHAGARDRYTKKAASLIRKHAPEHSALADTIDHPHMAPGAYTLQQAIQTLSGRPELADAVQSLNMAAHHSGQASEHDERLGKIRGQVFKPLRSAVKAFKAVADDSFADLVDSAENLDGADAENVEAFVKSATTEAANRSGTGSPEAIKALRTVAVEAMRVAKDLKAIDAILMREAMAAGGTLRESGFTGTITDKAGRKQTYVNGQHVKGSGDTGDAAVADTTNHPTDVKGWASKIGAAVSAVEHKAKSLWGAGVKKLPPKMQTIVNGSIRLSMLTYAAGYEAAKGAAESRGLDESAIQKIGQFLAIGDVIGMKAFPAILGAAGIGGAGMVAGSFVPVASMAYLGYSLSKNPRGVLNAAKKAIAAVKRTFTATEAIDGELADLLAQRFADAGDRADWYQALLAVALDKTRDLRQAVQVADEAFGSGDTAELSENFTGTKTDSLGRKMTFVNGVHVPGVGESGSGENPTVASATTSATGGSKIAKAKEKHAKKLATLQSSAAKSTSALQNLAVKKGVPEQVAKVLNDAAKTLSGLHQSDNKIATLEDVWKQVHEARFSGLPDALERAIGKVNDGIEKLWAHATSADEAKTAADKAERMDRTAPERAIRKASAARFDALTDLDELRNDYSDLPGMKELDDTISSTWKVYPGILTSDHMLNIAKTASKAAAMYSGKPELASEVAAIRRVGLMAYRASKIGATTTEAVDGSDADILKHLTDDIHGLGSAAPNSKES